MYETLKQEFVNLNPMFQDITEVSLLFLVTWTYQKLTFLFFLQQETANGMETIFGLTKLICGQLHENMTWPQLLSALDAFQDANV